MKYCNLLLAVGEYDDIVEVGRRLVETTSLFRDGIQIQRRFTQEVDSNSNNQQIVDGPVKPGRLAPIPRSEPGDAENRGLNVYFVFDVSKSVQIGETHIEAIQFAKAFVDKVCSTVRVASFVFVCLFVCSFVFVCLFVCLFFVGSDVQIRNVIALGKRNRPGRQGRYLI